jgi:hypothetical protein
MIGRDGAQANADEPILGGARPKTLAPSLVECDIGLLTDRWNRKKNVFR